MTINLLYVLNDFNLSGLSTYWMTFDLSLLDDFYRLPEFSTDNPAEFSTGWL